MTLIASHMILKNEEWDQVLSCGSSPAWGFTRQLMIELQAHDSTDFGQTVAMFQMCTTNELIASRTVRTGIGGEELA